ncbi:MAG: hypothetical protein U1E05_00105, partial [Patescibacteria group bacterium]|nr:hypothetical protein [Patescibacteria group bacterium]
EDQVEVAFRVQSAVYRREGLPSKCLYPILARLVMLADDAGKMKRSAGALQWDCRVALHVTPRGLAASVDIPPRVAAVKSSQALAARHHLEFVDLIHFEALAELLRLVPWPVLRRNIALPLGRDEGGELKVAVSAPPTPRRLDALRLAFNSLVSVAIATEDDLLAALYRHGHVPDSSAVISSAAGELLNREPY